MLRVGSPSGNGSLPERPAWWFVRPLGRETGLITAAILAYFGIRNMTAGSPEPAFANADRIFAFEARLRVDWEAALQGLVIDHDWLVTAANWVYIWGHWPVIIASAVVLFLLRRPHYTLLRNALFISGGIGFLFFAFFAVAPPRLMELGLIDTVTERSNAYRALQPPGLTNQYAAFPSLHAGWNLLVGIVLFLAFASLAVRVFAVLMPTAMALAVVLTANHFVVDVVAGYAVVLVGLAGAVAIRRRQQVATTLRRDGVSGDGRAEHHSAEHSPVRSGASGR